MRSLIGGGGGGGAVADAALLIGLPDAGKTALFEQLHFGRLRQTLTSMRENQCSIVDGGKSVPLIDVPGHARLRENIREKYAKQAKRVVFVIDAKEFKETSRETAECVHLSRSILPLLLRRAHTLSRHVLLVRFRGRAHLKRHEWLPPPPPLLTVRRVLQSAAQRPGRQRLPKAQPAGRVQQVRLRHDVLLREVHQAPAGEGDRSFALNKGQRCHGDRRRGEVFCGGQLAP